jgi:hypothetical protein
MLQSAANMVRHAIDFVMTLLYRASGEMRRRMRDELPRESAATFFGQSG